MFWRVLILCVIIASHDILPVLGMCGGCGGGWGGRGYDNDDGLGDSIAPLLIGFLIAQVAGAGAGRVVRSRQGIPPGDLNREQAEVTNVDQTGIGGRSSILTKSGDYPDWCTWCKEGGPPQPEIGAEKSHMESVEKISEEANENVASESKIIEDILSTSELVDELPDFSKTAEGAIHKYRIIL